MYMYVEIIIDTEIIVCTKMLWRPGPDLFMYIYMEIIVDIEIFIYTKMLWRRGPNLLFTYIDIGMNLRGVSLT